MGDFQVATTGGFWVAAGASPTAMVKRLEQICASEGTQLSHKKLFRIAEAKWGNPRAAINQLEMLLLLRGKQQISSIKARKSLS
jgi:DNA polymerase III delta prime subunit